MTERRYLSIYLDGQPGDYFVLKCYLERESEGDATYPGKTWDAEGYLSSMCLGHAQCNIKMQFGGSATLALRDPSIFYAHHDIHISESSLRDAVGNVRWAKVVDKANRELQGDIDEKAPWAYLAMLARALRIPTSRIVVKPIGMTNIVYRGSECRYRLEEALEAWRPKPVVH